MTESHSVSSKHKSKDSDRSSKHSSNKEGNKSPCKCHMFLVPQPTSTERASKECCMDDPTSTSSANMHTHPQSPSKCMSETEDQSSFAAPSSTSTPNKIGSGPHYCSSSMAPQSWAMVQHSHDQHSWVTVGHQQHVAAACTIFSHSAISHGHFKC